MTIKLRPYQEQIVQHILTHPRCAIWAGMGLGKTSATLTALSQLSGKTLVLAPLRVAKTTWPDEVAKWGFGFKVSVVIGTPAERLAALGKPADIYTMNYDNLPWLLDTLKKWPFTNIVCDESTRLKSFRLRQGGKRAQALARVAFVSQRFIELTGTPSPNGLQDLWGQAYFLDKGQRLGASFSAFTDRWFQAKQMGPNAYAIKLTPLRHAQKEIEGKLSDLCISLDAGDYFDLQQAIHNKLYVELPPKARALYKDMEEQMFAALASGATVEALNSASKSVKCLQLANGAAYTDDKGNWEEVHTAKLEALDSILEEAAGMPVLVAYHFKSDLARLQARYPQARTMDSNPATLKAWNAGEIPILLLHPESAGHGLNMQDGGNILVFYGHWWALEPYLQVIERIGPVRQAQAGYKRPVFIHHVIAKGTVDELVIRARDEKRTVQDVLMEALNEKRSGRSKEQKDSGSGGGG